MALTKITGEGVGAITGNLTVDTTNDLVGINTATPSDMYYNDLVVNSGDEGGITILDTSSGQSALAFGDGTSGNARYRGRILYDHNTDSLSIGTAGEQYWTMDSAHIITTPKQPAFCANPSATLSNFATNGYQNVNFDSERFDRNADYNAGGSPSTFTAPVTGIYQLNFALYILSVDTGASYFQFSINTSNREYTQIIDPNFSGDLGYFDMSIAVAADMDANDTAYVRFYQYQGDAILDLAGNSSFSGYLIG